MSKLSGLFIDMSDRVKSQTVLCKTLIYFQHVTSHLFIDMSDRVKSLTVICKYLISFQQATSSCPNFQPNTILFIDMSDSVKSLGVIHKNLIFSVQYFNIHLSACYSLFIGMSDSVKNIMGRHIFLFLFSMQHLPVQTFSLIQPVH